MLRRTFASLSVLAVGLGGAMTVVAPAGADSTHTVTAAPSTNLTDGQVVTVMGTGFREFGQQEIWTVAQCSGALTDDPILLTANALQSCDLNGPNAITVAADAAGGITTPFTVRASIAPPQIGTIDCRTASAGCVILVSMVVGDGSRIAGALVPISFAQPAKTIRDCAVDAWRAAFAGEPHVLRNFLRCVFGVLFHHRRH